MDELLLALLILTHGCLLLLLLLAHNRLNLAIQLHIHLITDELHLKMDQSRKGLQFWQLVVDLQQLLVDVIDYEDGRMLYGLLQDHL